MPRVIIKTAKKPFVLKPQAAPVSVCMCGLSKNQPFCDGSHLKTQDEKDDELYQYDENGERMKECCCEEGEEGCACNAKKEDK